MNARVQFVLESIQKNGHQLVLANGVIAFVTVPVLALTVFEIKKDLVTLTLLTTLVYWVCIILYYSWKAKKEVN